MIMNLSISQRLPCPQPSELLLGWQSSLNLVKSRARYNEPLFYHWKQETCLTLNMKFVSPGDAVMSVGDMLWTSTSKIKDEGVSGK